MAIRAAEFGLPAVIGIGEQRYRELAVARMLGAFSKQPCSAGNSMRLRVIISQR